MDAAATIRGAAREAVTDTVPAGLHDRIDARLAEASMAPGALALRTARALGDEAASDVAETAAGVQLIYEGLRLTRSLAHEAPWRDLDEADCAEADVEIVAADVLVSRGFYLLARTPAAEKAVETVRAFGREQTYRQQASTDAERADHDATLEADVLELAVETGAAAAGADPSALGDIAAAVAADGGVPLGAAGVVVPSEARLRRAAGLGPDGGLEDGVANQATDP